MKASAKICITAIVLLFWHSSHGQGIVNISNGTVTTCDGVFEDDGPAGGNYSATPYTFTLCPDNAGDVISVQFFAFALNTNPNPNNSDYILIYDGDSPAANSLGSYTGGALQGIPVTGTVSNTSGCLTFVFNPNPNTPGTAPGWAAQIVCTTPCANPTVSSQFVDPLPAPGETNIGVCLDTDVSLAGAGSAAAPGFNLVNYIWKWGDGTETITQSPAAVSHAFSEPGEYIVNLFVEDNNGCVNLNLDPKQVLVSTIPIFNTEFSSPVCVGSPTTIDGDGIQSVTWTALPPQVVAGETFLADGAGFAYSSSLVFDFFPIDAELESCDDLFSIFVNMEHSYLGDLSFFITCPNGTSVTTLAFPNGGGGTFLGEAVDDNTIDNFAQGNGFDYGWSPNSTSGFINDNANWTQTSFVNNVGITHNVNIANPGIYQSEEDLCNFVGCPLNGEWTFNVTDNIAADNGYIFEWGIEFNPLLFPDITTFTPVIGLETDSTFWEGPNIISTSNNGNTIQVLFDQTGFYDYTFFSTNNFGCTFDTTITIEAIVGPEITAGPDLFLCDEPGILLAGLASGTAASCSNSSGQYTYCYGPDENIVVTFCPDNPGDGVSFMGFNILQGSVSDFWAEFYVYDGDNIAAPVLDGPLGGNLAGQSFEATNPNGCITFQLISEDFSTCSTGAQTPLVISVNCIAGGGLIYSWSPAAGLSNPNVQNPEVFVEQTTVFTLSAFPPGLPGCLITDQVTVGPDAAVNPGLDTDTIICYNSPQSALVAYLKGTPALNGTWLNQDGNPISGQFNPFNFSNGANLVYTYNTDNGNCQKMATLNITVLPATNQTCCLTNAVAGENAIACALDYELKAFPTIGTGSWSGPDGAMFSDINDPNATVTVPSPGGSYTLIWTDTVDQLCQASDEVTVIFADLIEIVLIPTDAICHNECSGSAIAIPLGGTPDGNGIYNYLWSGGEAGLTGQMIEGLCVGDHSVRVVDNVGCTDSLIFSIGQPSAQEILALTAPPLCADSCNGRVTVFSQGAVDYSYDGGGAWSTESIGFVCAGTHMIIARNEAGCEVFTEVTLIDPARFEARINITPNPTTIRNALIQFQDVSTPGPIASTFFTFGENGRVGKSTERLAQWPFPSDTSGTYPITMISINAGGCTDTIVQQLVIRDDLLWFIPNAFSPNQDALNELWKPQGSFLDLTAYSLEIFDRWGKRMFETTDFDQGWNGSVNGSSHFAEAGVYTYFIRVKSTTTKETHELTGFVVLFR